MHDEFPVFDTIKNVLNHNNKLIVKGRSHLSLLYFGFCNHLYYYMDAYKTLFNVGNYYVCKTIERAVLDLYIKARVLCIAIEPEELAKCIIEKGQLKKDYLRPGVIKECSVTKLCEFFDEYDGNILSVDSVTGQKRGALINKYRDACKYVHPDMPCVWSYTTDTLNDWQTLIRNDKEEFIQLAYNTNVVLSRIFQLVFNKQNGEQNATH